jgi:hypothetical protein
MLSQEEDAPARYGGHCTVLAGCAASTGVLPAGPDTYAVSAKFAPIRGGSLAAQPEALAEAQSYCQNQARIFLPVQMGETAPRAEFGSTGYQIVFKCLPPGDPALSR